MKRPSFGHASLAAIAGAMVGSMTGLIAVGVVPAIVRHDALYLIKYPTIGMICFFLGGPTGWILGGQLAPLFERSFRYRHSHLIGGIVGGLIPFFLFVCAGWYLWTH